MNTSNDGLERWGIPSTLGRGIVPIFGVGLIVALVVWFCLERDPVQAALKGNYVAVARLVKNDPSIVNRSIDGGWTLLYAAAYGDHPEIVEFLIESGADPDLPIGGQGKDSIDHAILALSNQTLNHIGLSPHREPSPMRPVHCAAEQGSARAMKALVEGGADLNLPGGLFSEPPIMIAAKRGDVEVVKVLLDAGVDPNTRVSQQDHHDPDTLFVDTTLEAATTRGHAEVVKLLLERGAAVTYMNGEDLESELATF